MMTYRVELRASAAKSLRALDGSIQARIISKLDSLAGNPRPAGSVKLTGGENLWRVRVGDWRAVYSIDDGARLVNIRIIAHRREVYRDI